MSKERNIIELFEIALNYFDDLFDNMGLCGYFYKLSERDIINEDECRILIKFIYKHKPRTITAYATEFFWQPYSKKPRKAYLQRMLNTLYKQSHGIYGKDKKVI
jgi:hypothetical protein